MNKLLINDQHKIYCIENMSSSWLFIILTFISIKSFSLFIAAYQEHESDPLSDFEHNVISDEDTESLTGYVNIRGSLSQWHYQDLFGGRAGGGVQKSQF